MSEGQSGKRAHAGTEEASISSGCSTPPIQLAASHSPIQPEPKPITLPSSPVKVTTDPSDGVVLDASGSTMTDTPQWRSVRMTLTRVAMSEIQTSTHGRALPTLVPRQQMEIASHIQILTRQLLNPPTRSSGRKYGPLQHHTNVPLDGEPAEVDW